MLTQGPSRRVLRLVEALRPRGASSQQTLSGALSGRDNSLGLIRLVLAATVLASHAFPLGGWGSDPVGAASRGQATLGTLAVLGFFSISGYLITRSGERGTTVPFVWRRAIRIMPAFWIVLMVSALAFGPLSWAILGRPVGAYFTLSADGPFEYIVQNFLLTIHQWGIGDLYLTTTPFGNQSGIDSMNGSLWTLQHEAACYAIVAALIALGLMAKRTVVLPALAIVASTILAVCSITQIEPSTFLPGWASTEMLRLVVAFLWGATLAAYATRVRLSHPLGATAAIVSLGTLLQGGFWIVGAPAFAYAVLWAAWALPRPFRRIGAKNDYSYGLYLYAWPVQQLTVVLGWNTWGYFPWVLTTLVIAGALAVASWHGIEKHALRLRDWGPGRDRARPSGDESSSGHAVASVSIERRP